MSELCPYCNNPLDHSEPEEWHSMKVGDVLIVECSQCHSPIKITADISWFIDYLDERERDEYREQKNGPDPKKGAIRGDGAHRE